MLQFISLFKKHCIEATLILNSKFSSKLGHDDGYAKWLPAIRRNLYFQYRQARPGPAGWRRNDRFGMKIAGTQREKVAFSYCSDS